MRAPRGAWGWCRTHGLPVVLTVMRAGNEPKVPVTRAWRSLTELPYVRPTWALNLKPK